MKSSRESRGDSWVQVGSGTAETGQLQSSSVPTQRPAGKGAYERVTSLKFVGAGKGSIDKERRFVCRSREALSLQQLCLLEGSGGPESIRRSMWCSGMFDDGSRSDRLGQHLPCVLFLADVPISSHGQKPAVRLGVDSLSHQKTRTWTRRCV